MSLTQLVMPDLFRHPPWSKRGIRQSSIALVALWTPEQVRGDGCEWCKRC